MLQELEKMIELIRRGETFAVASVLRASGSPGRIGHKMIIRANGECHGTIGGGSLEERVKVDAGEALKARQGLARTYVLSQNAENGLDSLCGGKLEVAIEIVPGRPNLLLVGGGHVARAVGRLCDLLDYPYSVVDDREDVTRRADWPGASEVICDDPAKYINRNDLQSYSHLILLNYSHRHDFTSLKAALEQFHGKIGMIGSDRKRKKLYAELPPELREKTDAVRCPIGIPMPAVSPAEIAVSILAQVIGDQDPSYRESKKGRGE